VQAMARDLLARDGTRYRRDASEITAGAEGDGVDPETGLDLLIANAKCSLVAGYAAIHARLALAVAVQQILRNGVALLGVSAPEKM